MMLMGCTSTFTCPETKLYDFNQKVEREEDAIKLFKEYFSEEKGFPPFNESKVTEPSEHLELFAKVYIYYDMYGFGPNNVGGVLYKDGKLVRKGYCK